MHVHMTNFTVHYYLIGWDKAWFKYKSISELHSVNFPKLCKKLLAIWYQLHSNSAHTIDGKCELSYAHQVTENIGKVVKNSQLEVVLELDKFRTESASIINASPVEDFIRLCNCPRLRRSIW